MGVAGGGGGGAAAAAAAAAIAGSHLGFDPRIRCGLSDAAAAAAVGASRQLRNSPELWAAGGALPRARALLRAAGVPEAVPARPAKTQSLTAFPPAAAVFALRAASAWHAAPAGRVAVAWAWRAPAFSLNVTLPAGVAGRVALPVAVLRAAAAAGAAGAARVTARREGGGGGGGLSVSGALRVRPSGAPGCAPIGAVGGDAWEWCAAGAGGAGAPRAVGWAEAEGEGRLRGGAPGGEDGAVLWEIEGEGEWVWGVEAV